MPNAALPPVTVIVPTKHRSELLRRAVDAVRAQDYGGEVQTLVIYDDEEPDFALACGGDRPVVVLTNTRQPGLAGARNTGIMLTNSELIAFCDDDDAWLPDKLSTQVPALLESPDTALVTCGMRIEYGDRTIDRTLRTDWVTLDELIRDRHAELHSSSFVFRREQLLGLGMVNEDLPGSFGEDYDLLLRTARKGRVRNVPGVHVRVRRHSATRFVRRWQSMEEALRWFLQEYPELGQARVGGARISGQIAFATAAQGHRSEALRWAGRTVRRNPGEARAYLALAVASGVMRPDTLLTRLHRHGHSI
ncbi:MAG: glycosyltransferase [Streptosporangiales bacterium]|nr:glycosyltransferase [Streptosporangiales bacterium]